MSSKRREELLASAGDPALADWLSGLQRIRRRVRKTLGHYRRTGKITDAAH